MTNLHNQRQLQLMREVLNCAQPQLNSLRDVIASLEFLIGQLQDPDSSWISNFSSQWWVLEEIYAGVLAENSNGLSQEHVSAVTSVFQQLEQLIQAYLSECQPVDVDC